MFIVYVSGGFVLFHLKQNGFAVHVPQSPAYGMSVLARILLVMP